MCASVGSCVRVSGVCQSVFCFYTHTHTHIHVRTHTHMHTHSHAHTDTDKHLPVDKGHSFEGRIPAV
jgi:hypothetical protein